MINDWHDGWREFSSFFVVVFALGFFFFLSGRSMIHGIKGVLLFLDGLGKDRNIFLSMCMMGYWVGSRVEMYGMAFL